VESQLVIGPYSSSSIVNVTGTGVRSRLRCPT
jgi:hypothetical protein